MEVISCEIRFNRPQRTPETALIRAGNAPRSLEKVMAALSGEVPELAWQWQVVEERIKKHKELGMRRWKYYLNLKTATSQIYSPFCGKARGTSITEQLIGGCPLPQLRSGMVAEMLL